MADAFPTREPRTSPALPPGSDLAAFQREMFDLARDGMFLLAQDGSVRESNEAFARMLGYTRAEMKSLHVWDWDTQWSRDELLAMIRELDEPGDNFETRHRRRDGSQLDVEISTNVFRHGDEKLVCCVLRDITERKKAAESLRASEERFAAIFNGTTNALAFTEPGRGSIVDVNAAWGAIMGVPRERALGQTARDLGLWAVPAERDLCLARLQATGHLRDFEVLLTTVSGQRPFLVSADRVAIRGVDYVLWEFRDIEHLREAQREQEQLRRQLYQAQKMEAVGQMAGGIAHDFNNLLQVITGRAEIVSALLPAGHESHKHLAELSAASRRAAALVGQILAFSRRQRMQPEALDLNEVVSGALPLLEQIVGAGVAVCFEPGAALAQVRADRGMIEQLLVNLGVNARDAMDAQGTLRIATANVVVDQDMVAMDERAAPGSYVLLSVTDTGCGMDLSTQARIFEPFFTTKDVGKGTGLGLSVVHGIVRQHAGLVQVASEPGRGSTFNVYLPVIDETGDKA